jgi:hypothetical protein
VVLAVDATPGRGGGLLLFHKSLHIEFYSFDWTETFRFPTEPQYQRPDIFELANALLAMSFWKDDIPRITGNNFELVVKFDNSKIDRVHVQGRGGSHGPLERANELLREIGGSWKRISASEDSDMDLADKLSKKKIGLRQLELAFPGYGVYDFSHCVGQWIDRDVKPHVPPQFHR